MSKKILAKITEEERDVVEDLYERSSSLKSLIISLSEKNLESNEQNFLYKTISNDWCNTKKKYNVWWQNISKKYNFSKGTIGNLYVSFEEMNIYPRD